MKYRFDTWLKPLLDIVVVIFSPASIPAVVVIRVTKN
jgi:hypothetical protein